MTDRLLVRYRRDDGDWQADWTMPIDYDELGVYRRANRRAAWLRNNDDREDVEVVRITPKDVASGARPEMPFIICPGCGKRLRQTKSGQPRAHDCTRPAPYPPPKGTE